MILELGANDMLRGVDPSVTRTALAEILRNLEARRIVVLLCGAQTRTTFRDEYKSAFAAMFSGLASEHNVLFYPAFDDALWTMLNSSCWTACTQTQPESKRSSRAYCQMSKP